MQLFDIGAHDRTFAIIGEAPRMGIEGKRVEATRERLLVLHSATRWAQVLTRRFYAQTANSGGLGRRQ